MTQSSQFFIIYLIVITVTSCMGNDDMICLENLENSIGRNMPSFTECQDQYAIDSTTVFKVSIDIKKQKTFLEKNQFMDVCSFKTSNHRTCKDYVDHNFGFLKDYNEIQHANLLVSFWTTSRFKILALADPHSGKIWFLVAE